MPPIVEAVRVVGGAVGGVVAGGNNKARLIMLTSFDPVSVTMAAPVASLMATPVGFVPMPPPVPVALVMSGTIFTAGFEGRGRRSRMEALLLPLLATTARPLCCQIAMPCGLVPTETGPPII